jgi:hypothetical protein
VSIEKNAQGLFVALFGQRARGVQKKRKRKQGQKNKPKKQPTDFPFFF